MQTTISEKIQAACAATKPKTKERNKALKSIRWVLMSGAEYASLNADFDCILVEDVELAQVFTGMDNERAKADFWSTQLDRRVTPTLLLAF